MKGLVCILTCLITLSAAAQGDGTRIIPNPDYKPPSKEQLQKAADELIAMKGPRIDSQRVRTLLDQISWAGSAGAPYYVQVLTRADELVRREFGMTPPAAVPELYKALSTQDPLVLDRVLWALGDSREATHSIDAIAEMMRHYDQNVRNRARDALGWGGIELTGAATRSRLDNPAQHDLALRYPGLTVVRPDLAFSEPTWPETTPNASAELHGPGGLTTVALLLTIIGAAVLAVCARLVAATRSTRKYTE